MTASEGRVLTLPTLFGQSCLSMGRREAVDPTRRGTLPAKTLVALSLSKESSPLKRRWLGREMLAVMGGCGPVAQPRVYCTLNDFVCIDLPSIRISTW